MKRQKFIYLLVLCLVFSGCATLNGAVNGLFGGFTGLLNILFKGLHGIADILGKLPSF